MIEKAAFERHVREFRTHGWFGIPFICRVSAFGDKAVSLILRTRRFCGIPTKDKFTLDGEGRIARIDYSPTYDGELDQRLIDSIYGDWPL